MRKSILCYLGFHMYGNVLYQAGEEWAQPFKPIIMRECVLRGCNRRVGYVRDATSLEVKAGKALNIGSKVWVENGPGNISYVRIVEMHGNDLMVDAGHGPYSTNLDHVRQEE